MKISWKPNYAENKESKKKDFLTLKYPWLLNTAKTKIHDIIMNM